MKNATWAVALRNAKLNAIKAQFDNGYLQIWDDSAAQPTGPDDAIAGTLLAELRFGATAFADATTGVLVANPLTSDPAANATGTAARFRCLASDHATALHDGTVGTANANAVVATTAIVINSVVDCASFSITDAPASAL